MKLLHIDSSILGVASASRALTADTVAQWRTSHPETQVEYLDLALTPPSHLNVRVHGPPEGVRWNEGIGHTFTPYVDDA